MSRVMRASIRLDDLLDHLEQRLRPDSIKRIFVHAHPKEAVQVYEIVLVCLSRFIVPR